MWELWIMSSTTIKFMGEMWDIDFHYYAGTNYTIHSASEQPNDAEEVEIETFKHSKLNMSDEFLDEFFEQNFEELDAALIEHIRESGI